MLKNQSEEISGKCMLRIKQNRKKLRKLKKGKNGKR